MSYAPARINLASTDLRTSDGANFRKNQARYSRHGGGSLHAGFQSVLRESPTIEYRTGDLRRLFTVLDAADAPSGPGAITATWARANDNTLPYASTQAKSFANAMHFLNSLSFSSGEVAQAAVTAFGTSGNGTTDPTTSSTPAPPAQIADVEEWVLTTIVRGGTSITKWASVEISVTHNATTQADECFNGQLPFPLLVASGGSRGGIEVALTITGLDLATTLPTDGTIVLTLLPKVRGQVGLGSGAITITLVPGLEDSDITDGSPSQRSITVLCRHDGTNRPLTITLPA
jgi:hypothetical protein